MKTKFLFLFILGCVWTANTFAFSPTYVRQQIILSVNHDITDAARPHRIPSRNQCPISLFYNEEMDLIELQCNTDLTEVIINIFDDEILINSNIILNDSDEFASISVADLPSGVYRIEVIINEVHYEGYLELQEQP